MASAPSPPTVASGSAGYDEFVDSRIARTRAAVKTADLATGAGVLIAWALFVLLVAAVADHWLVAGGLDRVARYALWGVGLAGAGLYVATRLGPTLWLSVNPLYAAREIERESPDLKNSLLNLLQLRGGAETTAVRHTLERQAAERLAKSGDAPIDHTPLLRVAKLLLALVAVVGVYVVASPKDFFASAGRVIAPWSQVAAPSRVRFDSVEPGSIKVSQGEQIRAETMVTGLREGDLVELVYSTADGRVVNRRVPMRPSEGGLHFSGTLPPGGGAAAAMGVQGDLTYRLEAGDARTPNYRVRVLTSPTIAPVSVRYDYPAYTGYASRETEGVGDLRALEGTRVTITAEANLLVDTAQIDLGADGRPDVRMKVDWKRATGAFALRLDGDGPTSSTSYVMRFTSTDGQANHDPPQYRVEVIGDLPPEAAILEPLEETLDVPLNRPTALAIEARDPDFALKRVRLIGESGGRRVLQRDLLTGDGRGKFATETSVTPQKIGLRPGDVLDYWVEATDNRTPNPGAGRSERQRLRVVGPANGNGEGRQQDGGAAGEGDRGEGSPQSGRPDPNGENEPRPGEPGARGDENQPGQEGQQRPDQQRPDQQRPDQQGAGQQEQDGAARDDRRRREQQGQQGDQEQRSGEQPPNAGAEQRPNNQKQPDEGEDGERGEGNDPPPGGLTGPSNEGGDDPPGEPTEGQGTEGEGSSDAGDQNSGAGGSQSGNDAGAQQQRRPGGSGGEQVDRRGAEEGAGGDGEPVARDGADDGSAFERIQEYLKDQQGSDEQGQPGATRERRPDEGGNEEFGEDPSGETQDAEGQSGNASEGSSDQNNGADGESANDGRQAGEGDSRGGSENGQPRPRDDAAGERTEPSEQGPGAGERDRSGASSDSTSGDPGGDTPPGESADPEAGPRQGTDGAGQSQSADRGAGQSADRGEGDSSGRPGGEETSDSRTSGESGDEAGEGSRSRESSDTGEKEGSKSGDGESQGDKSGSGEPGGSSDQGAGGEGSSGREGDAEGPDSINDRRGEGAQDSQGSQGGNPGQRGGPKELVDRGTTADGPGEGSEVGGDEANLDYARKQTDLVLERLEEQLRKKEVDRRLLDKLGWTEDDLQRFVERWRTRKRQAAQRGAEGEAQLDRALRSLGLEPGGPTATRKTTDDSLRDLRERTRTKTPPRLREALERYNRSLNASGPPAESD